MRVDLEEGLHLISTQNRLVSLDLLSFSALIPKKKKKKTSHMQLDQKIMAVIDLIKN